MVLINNLCGSHETQASVFAKVRDVNDTESMERDHIHRFTLDPTRIPGDVIDTTDGRAVSTQLHLRYFDQEDCHFDFSTAARDQNRPSLKLLSRMNLALANKQIVVRRAEDYRKAMPDDRET